MYVLTTQHIKGRQLATDYANVEELGGELAVIDDKIADLSAQKVQLVERAIELKHTTAAIKSQI
jgi:hypothetical protein